MFDRIVVPVDGSPTAQAVVPYASWLARSVEARVEVLIVVPSRAEVLRALSTDFESGTMEDLAYPYLDAGRLDEVHATLRGRAEVAVGRLVEGLRDQGLDAAARVEDGDPAGVLLAVSHETPDTVIAMATHGRSGIPRWFVGSVTTKVIRESERPVLAIRPHDQTTAPAKSSGIVVPLDGSARAEVALPHARELAAKLGLPIHLVRSVSLSGLGYGFVEDGPAQYADLAGSVEHTAREYVASVAKGLRFPGNVKVTESVVDKAPDEAIVDAVGPEGDKLVVMTTHGRSGLNRLVLGSVTDRVVRRGAGPVLIVPSLGT